MNITIVAIIHETSNVGLLKKQLIIRIKVKKQLMTLPFLVKFNPNLQSIKLSN